MEHIAALQLSHSELLLRQDKSVTIEFLVGGKTLEGNFNGTKHGVANPFILSRFFNKLEFTDLPPTLPINVAFFNLYMRPNWP